ncbi:MAG TPA: sulfur carrier protein ThiS [Gammaproteobacteria bacterium]|nr:sulfur carrier protein ThiS [Gammaproteobacteria bacterium]
MKILVNGQERELPDELTAAGLIEQMGLTGQRLAMEVNEEIVPRSTFDTHVFQDADRVEIVHAVGGG